MPSASYCSLHSLASDTHWSLDISTSKQLLALVLLALYCTSILYAVSPSSFADVSDSESAEEVSEHALTAPQGHL